MVMPSFDNMDGLCTGRFYEVTLLALLFGFDVVVVFHHTVRVVMIFEYATDC